MTSAVCTTNNNSQRLVVYLSCLLLCLTETAVTGFGRYPTTSIIQKSLIPWEYYRLGPKNNKSSSSSSSSVTSRSSSSSSSNNKKSIDDEIREMEQQVMASARQKLDFDRVALALREDDETLAAKQASLLLLPSSKTQPFFLTPEERATAQSQQLQVALASTIVTAAVSFLLFSNVFITAILSAFVFWSANSDPLENKDNNDDDENLVGAIARMVGRSTLQSYQQTTPKVKAVARAVVGTSEREMALLKARIQELEQDEIVVRLRLQQRIERLQVENSALQVYKQQREQVDQHCNRFTLPELKQMARDYNLPVSGTKDQVLMRLLQAGAIDLEESAL